MARRGAEGSNETAQEGVALAEPLSWFAMQTTAGQRTNLFILRGVPSFIRSDTGPEFSAEAVRNRIKAVGVKTVYIEPGSPLSAMPCIACRAARGRMDIAKASMVACGTTF